MGLVDNRVVRWAVAPDNTDFGIAKAIIVVIASSPPAQRNQLGAMILGADDPMGSVRSGRVNGLLEALRRQGITANYGEFPIGESHMGGRILARALTDLKKWAVSPAMYAADISGVRREARAALPMPPTRVP